jgi:hypothetical protein
MNPRYDIFRGSKEQTPMWLESTDRLRNAYERMVSLAEEKPGPYFIFDSHDSTVVDKLDTSDGDVTKPLRF